LKKLLVVLLTFAFLGVAAAAISFFYFLSGPAGPGREPVIVDIAPGRSFASVIEELSKKGLLKNALFFRAYLRITGQSTGVKVGEYELHQGMSPQQIVSVITSGRSIERPFTVPEGFSIYDIALALSKLVPDRSQDFLALSKDKKFIVSVLGPEFGSRVDSFEGFLFPETYLLTKYTSPEQLIKDMVRNFQRTFSELQTEAASAPMDPLSWLTMASVIEKETGAAAERPMISSVFHNRLKKKMKLQSDPTIIYGHWIVTGEYLENIQKKHILESNDYNTYVVPALPKGPICNPGRESLRATVNPTPSNYLYFVSRNDGTHVFTPTYEDHLKAVREYQLRRGTGTGH
jgi:UPF0755 protein